MRPRGGRNLPSERNITKGGFSLSSVPPVSYIRLSATCFSVNFRRPGKHRGLYLSPGIFFPSGESDDRCSFPSFPLYAPAMVKEKGILFFPAVLGGGTKEKRSVLIPGSKFSMMDVTLDYTFSGTKSRKSALSEAGLLFTTI